MKLRIALLIVAVYIVVAFGWLTISLLDLTEDTYQWQKKYHSVGSQALLIKVIEEAKNESFVGPNSMEFVIEDFHLSIDSNKLNSYLEQNYQGVYKAIYRTRGRRNELLIRPSAAFLEELNQEGTYQKQLYLFQAILLSVLVCVGIYGVSYGLQLIFKINKQQQNFLLSVTHEFKTPIATIRLLLQTLQRPNLGEEKNKMLLGKAVESTDRLNELAENMLTAMRIGEKQYRFDEDEFDLSRLAMDSVDRFRLEGEVNAEIEPEIIFKGDSFLIKLLVNNLLENAQKYSGFAPVDISLKQQQSKIILEIRDQGPGIPKKYEKDIFKRFFRIEDEETRTTKGTGLGLFIVKQTVNYHRGKIRIFPNQPKGTVFRVELPSVKN